MKIFAADSVVQFLKKGQRWNLAFDGTVTAAPIADVQGSQWWSLRSRHGTSVVTLTGSVLVVWSRLQTALV